MKQVTLCLLALLILSATFVAAGSFSEGDFKKMKIKDLRSFLEERGLTCTGCQEKSDFVRVAFANRDKKPLGQAEKREIPNAKLWEAWSSVAKRECEAATKKRGHDPSAAPFEGVCETIEKATESFIMQHGKRVANRLKKTPHHILKTSFNGVYYDAGVRLLKNLINYCLSSPSMQSNCESLGYVLDVMENNQVSNFHSWITNVGIENTNPMYDIIDVRDDL